MSRTGVLVVAAISTVVLHQMASAQLCVRDVVGAKDGENNCWPGPDGIVNFDDVSALTRAIQGTFVGYCDGTPTEERMDLNCDGQITIDDDAVFVCLDLGGSDLDCCPDCEPVVGVPAVSTWGILALVLLGMVAGTVVFRRAFVRPTV